MKKYLFPLSFVLVALVGFAPKSQGHEKGQTQASSSSFAFGGTYLASVQNGPLIIYLMSQSKKEIPSIQTITCDFPPFSSDGAEVTYKEMRVSDDLEKQTSCPSENSCNGIIVQTLYHHGKNPVITLNTLAFSHEHTLYPHLTPSPTTIHTLGEHVAPRVTCDVTFKDAPHESWILDLYPIPEPKKSDPTDPMVLEGEGQWTMYHPLHSK